MELCSTPRQLSDIWLVKKIIVPWKESLDNAVVNEGMWSMLLTAEVVNTFFLKSGGQIMSSLYCQQTALARSVLNCSTQL